MSYAVFYLPNEPTSIPVTISHRVKGILMEMYPWKKQRLGGVVLK